jgi:perosamine synthetase
VNYSEYFSDVVGLQLPLGQLPYAANLYWVFAIVLNNSSLSRSGLIEYLSEAGIGTRPFFFPIHRQPVFLKQGLFEGVELPIAEGLSASGLYLPSGLALTDCQISRVATIVLQYFR